ncbi:Zn-dependent hydrolase [Acinetobacter sp. ANC 4558]|uniref:Zn-dependent hydrolase n=1 Tax=Acinetobacter sp. ANC 4558 TaxID=1977876 RepID=UPI000A35B36E|nr:Zn-dependent hydrolase [Acinetobacter sp. ANC 4558]OTG84184.1 Zn-dependent hydrolase [Acinetobacter sp. ANC 4558]
MKVNGKRLWNSLMDMAKVGASENGGSTRLALTDQDIAGRTLLIEWAKKIDLTLKYDAIGNLFLQKAGLDSSLNPIVIGSHLDTQPKGGRFDGIYGVLAGLEVLYSLHETAIETHHPIELAVWMNEEGARFTPAMMGSAVFTGHFSLEEILTVKDKQGICVADELKRTQQQGELELQRAFEAYYELHIEQGPVLENNAKEIGVVTGGQAIIWLDIETTGKAAHAGTTPMSMRHDTMIGTAKMMVDLEQLVLQKYPEGLITFGEIAVENSSRNTIPATVNWTIDLRHPDDNTMEKMQQDVLQVLEQLANTRSLTVNTKLHWHSPATPFNETCVQTVLDSVQTLGFSYQKIVSGAGHDAINLAKHCPTTMIFIPCEGGLSHNEAENITALQAEQGAHVLLNSILKFDQQLKLAQVG